MTFFDFGSRAGALRLCTFVALLAWTSRSAHAQSEAALAESLFEEGRRLMESGDFGPACSKLAESHRLDPALGTLLNLALCNERAGKTATAWAQFREAQAMAVQRNDTRAEFAGEHIRNLEPTLSRITIVVPEAARLPDLVIELSGVAISAAAWGTPVPIDPGEHVLAAKAPSRMTWTTRVTVGSEPDGARVEIPVLGPTAEAPPTETQAPRVTPVRRDRSEGTPVRSRPLTGYVIGGVGVVALIVGGYYGVRALETNADAKAECPTDDSCTPEGEQSSKDAVRDARISTAAIGLGLVGVGVGAYLVVTSSKARPASVLSPSLSPNGGGVRWSGVF